MSKALYRDNYLLASSQRPYMVHHPTWVGTARSHVTWLCLESFDDTWDSRQTPKSLRICQSWLMFRWLALSGFGACCLGSMVTWQTYFLPRTCQSQSNIHGMDVPWGGSEYFQVACGEDHMWSQQISIIFQGCVTMSQGSLWFSEWTMHRNGSGSTISRHQF